MTTARTELDAVRVQRAEMREALGEVEAALAAPAQEDVWSAEVRSALQRLAAGFEAHIEVTEGPGGLHESILAGDLRLANAVDALTRAHTEIGTRLAAVLEQVAAPTVDVDALRERATDLLGRLARHRQRGADLVYEAFATDIGGTD